MLANSYPNDVIVLADGTYELSTTGDCPSPALQIGENKTLRAQTPGRAVLTSNYAGTVVSIEGGHVTLEGLTITGGTTFKYNSAGGLAILGGDAFVKDVYITGNRRGGILVMDAQATLTTASLRTTQMAKQQFLAKLVVLTLLMDAQEQETTISTLLQASVSGF